MITLYFLRTWLKWLGLVVLAVVVERALLGWSWLFALIGLVTLLLFGLASWLMYGDWRATRRYGTGYRYDFIRHIGRD